MTPWAPGAGEEPLISPGISPGRTSKATSCRRGQTEDTQSQARVSRAALAVIEGEGQHGLSGIQRITGMLP